MEASERPRPNKPLKLTPLRGPNAAPILKT
jgi:hypothetical protein